MATNLSELTITQPLFVSDQTVFTFLLGITRMECTWTWTRDAHADAANAHGHP